MTIQISPAAGSDRHVGSPRSRVDGPAKVTGLAKYAAEFTAEVSSTATSSRAPSPVARSPASTPPRPRPFRAS